ncbi:hypothetical protein [Psychrosphaera haliotis]|uniref:Uncharacterized protein n=1 Tax=Psychrosphaera haliotis TaxID=555083 RepID=A0A6N8F833_9GAMM|nr:hypothetical protein [Psychrosphaera haliotis]MUH72706.1 hypothetical protein [Psychrosphaera haliotis]
MKYLFVSLMCFALISPVTFATTKPIKLEAGIWEGISDQVGMNYNILDVNEDGQHAFYIANMASAMRYIKRIPFTDNNITCTSAECTLSLNDPRVTNEKYKIIISPHITSSFKVLSIISVDEKPTLTQTYQLDKIEGNSTTREFMKRYGATIQALDKYTQKSLYGFWVGTYNDGTQKKMVVLNAQPGQRSEFVVMLNGYSGATNETYFKDSDITTSDTITRISTSHKTFANQIIMHQQNNNMITGHMYSYYKGQVLQTASFQLYRVKR